MRRLLTSVAAVAMLVVTIAPAALADGSESLGPPTVAIAPATDFVVAGVGTELTQSGTITVAVPGVVKQVLLYWSGHYSPDPPSNAAGDGSITVNGIPVTGTLIGGPTCFFQPGGIPCFPLSGTPPPVTPYRLLFETRRADITPLGLVGTGTTSLVIAGLDYVSPQGGPDGAGVVVLYDEPGAANSTVAGLRDGSDLFFFRFPSPLDTTVPQSFGFTSSPLPRSASLGLHASSIEGIVSGFGSLRPNQIVVTYDVGGSQLFQNPFGSTVGEEYDAVTLPLAVPSGATSLTVQALSAADPANPLAVPASGNWIGAVLSIETPPPASGTGTPGYWKNHPEAWPVSTIVIGGTAYSRTDAIRLMSSGGGDKSLTMFEHLLSAKLNVLAGNASSCVSSTIAAADSWLAANPAGSRVRASSAAWRVGEPLKDVLDAYNNGSLCAPHRG